MTKKKILRSRNWDKKFPKTLGRLIGIGLIRIYQLFFSRIFGNSCRYLPTCSEYGYESIARYGLLIGGWLTVLRIIKCNPLGSHGFYPVPDSFPKNTILHHLWRLLKD
nr:membrane protein insertion efficiency factor YidD [Candidatus Liberibacter sp.]